MKYIGIIETENNGVFSVIKENNRIIAGVACNVGIIPQYEIIQEQGQTLDAALENLYNKIMED